MLSLAYSYVLLFSNQPIIQSTNLNAEANKLCSFTKLFKVNTLVLLGLIMYFLYFAGNKIDKFVPVKKENYIDLGIRGRLSKKNKLNDLTGKEWIKFTKSWFIHRPKKRKEEEILHPAKFPESLIEIFIRFFTKENGWVLDPFTGTGSTNIAALNSSRNCIGIDIIKKYTQIANRRIKKNLFEDALTNEVLLGDAFSAYELIRNKFPQAVEKGFDFCITSPPYWNQLKRNTMRQVKRKTKGLDTDYSILTEDIGNEDSYESFLEKQKLIFNEVYKLLKDKSYLVVITNNIFFNGKIYPLAFDTFNSLTKGEYAWTGKDEKIWCQDDKALATLGINNAWVGNRSHQYCLIFRKEEQTGGS